MEKDDVERGQVLAKPGSITPHTKFKAEVYILSKDEGGRHTPFFNGYRPQFYIRTTDVTGSLHLPEGVEMVMPGDNTHDHGGADHAGGDREGRAVRDSRRRPDRGRRDDYRDHRVTAGDGLRARATGYGLRAAEPEARSPEARSRQGSNVMRDIIALACTECKRRNYSTTKNKKKTTERLELSKYCRFCRKHIAHRETK